MRCSVVFGVTLRLLAINTSSSSPAINTAAYYQRCVTTCETVAVVHRQPCLQHLASCSVSVSTGSQARYYRLRIAISAYPTCIRRPRQGGSCRNIVTQFGMEKQEWCGYQTVKKIRFDMIHERDRHTDRRTGRWTDRQTPHDGIAQRGKNQTVPLLSVFVTLLSHEGVVQFQCNLGISTVQSCEI